MLRFPVDERQMQNAKKKLCFKCGSAQVSFSLIDLHRANEQDSMDPYLMDVLGWVCRQCYEDMLNDPNNDMFDSIAALEVVCGQTVFLDDGALTLHDVLEIRDRAEAFNKLLEKESSRTRFKLLPGHETYYRMEMTMAGADHELKVTAVVKIAETVIKQLCRRRIPFLKRRC